MKKFFSTTFAGLILIYGCATHSSIDSLRETLKNDPTNAEAHIQLGLALEKVKTYKEAHNHFLEAINISREALHADPDKAQPHFNLGMCYLFLGQYAEGVSSLEKSFRKDGQLKKKALRMIEHRIKEVSLKNPLNGRAYYAMGIVYSGLEHYEKAQQAFQDAIRIDPHNANFHFSLGTVYGKLGNTRDEIEEYKMALSIYPHEPDVHYNLAGAYGELNLYEEAISEYQEVLRLNPYYIEALNNLGGVYGALGNFDQAISVYNKALLIEPRNPVAHYNLGVAYDRINKGYEAITHMIQAEHFFEEVHDPVNRELSRKNLKLYYEKYGLSPGNVSHL